MTKQDGEPAGARRRVLVIGAGVVGLTTALALRERGYEVTVVADRFAPDLTSVVAGALWEWPPAVCGRHGDPRSLERSKRWCMTSYRKLKEMAAAFGPQATGIHLRQVYFYFNEKLEDQPFELGKMQELAAEVDDFEQGLQIVGEEIDQSFRGGIRDAYKHMAPMVDTDTYLAWLLERVRAAGIEIVADKIEGNLVENEEALLRRFGAAAVVNCAGLGALAISGDTSMYPLRGALVRLVDERRVITAAHCISRANAPTPEQNIIFIVPRGPAGVVLGGLVQKDRWDKDLSLDDPLIRQMYEGCLDFLPLLRSLPVDEGEPVRTGLRPFTRENVCVESVPGCRIVHNYGHGGAGVTLSWGCAEEVVARVDRMLQAPADLPPARHSRPAADTVVIVQGEPPCETDFRPLARSGRRLVLLTSRRALAHLVPAQYQHFAAIEVFDPLDPNALEAACRRWAGEDAGRIALATSDPGCVSLVADLETRLGDLVAGSPVRSRLRALAAAKAPWPAGAQHGFTVAVFERGELRYFAAGHHSHDPRDFVNGYPAGCLLLPASDPAWTILQSFTRSTLAPAAGAAALHGVFYLLHMLPEPGGEPLLTSQAVQPPPAPIVRLLAFCHGVRLDAVHLEAQLGGPLDLAGFPSAERRHGAAVWQPPRPGVVARITRPELRSELDASWRIYPGAPLAAPASDGDLALLLAIRHPDLATVRTDFERLSERFWYELEAQAPDRRGALFGRP